jgi:hypothetical protein
LATATFDVTIVGDAAAAGLRPGNYGVADGTICTDGNGDPNDAIADFLRRRRGGSRARPDVQKRRSRSRYPALGAPSPGDTIRYTINVVNPAARRRRTRLTDPVPTCTGALNPCTKSVPGSLARPAPSSRRARST